MLFKRIVYDLLNYLAEVEVTGKGDIYVIKITINILSVPLEITL